MLETIGLFSIFFLFLLICIKIDEKLVKTSDEKAEEVVSMFEELDEVCGILHGQHGSIHTYRSGVIYIDEVAIDTCYSGKRLEILDISVNEKSLFAYTPYQCTRSERVMYALEILRQIVNNGAVSKEALYEVEKTILEIETMNEHIAAGRIYQKDNGHYAFC